MAPEPKKNKYVLVTGIIIVIAIISWFTFDFRLNPDSFESPDKSVNINATMSLENVQQTALRDGNREWTLNATSATLFESEKKTLINEPVVTFYTQDSDNVQLTAREGIYHTDTNKIDVTGNVVINNSLYTLNTEKLHYEPDMRIIQSETPAVISSKTFNFQADKIVIDLNTNKAEMIGNVKGIIRGNFFH